MNTLTRTERLGYSLLLLVYALGIYFANTDLVYFDTVITKEDGFAEYGTALMLFCISVLCIARLIKIGGAKPALWKLGIVGMALIFLFGAGEEISWGQRIFGIESSEYFLENNAQQETNLHNMVVGETKINKLIFSQILTAVLVIYLLIVPVLYRKTTWLKGLAEKFAVPVPRWNHTIGLLLATGLLEFMKASSRRWELYEFAFGIIFFLIFINPLNGYIFKKN
ncbi:hypothetical protein [Urechidicola vernalis]|uniref:Uncharacterized protein n=1 Tax=Urechidicola vernalis TaxID=3075600 RepID=A0ABU2Y2Z8_9FLAO|nr:hypothetical protein [Urechidicola sp. P050]MDT0552165.1 hypothetical protein [Urechidicola sp. P050]